MLKPSAQVTKGGPGHNFAYFSMLIILSWRPKGGGGHGPPKYAPAYAAFTVRYRKIAKVKEIFFQFDRHPKIFQLPAS